MSEPHAPSPVEQDTLARWNLLSARLAAPAQPSAPVLTWDIAIRAELIGRVEEAWAHFGRVFALSAADLRGMARYDAKALEGRTMGDYRILCTALDRPTPASAQVPEQIRAGVLVILSAATALEDLNKRAQADPYSRL